MTEMWYSSKLHGWILHKILKVLNMWTDLQALRVRFLHLHSLSLHLGDRNTRLENPHKTQWRLLITTWSVKWKKYLHLGKISERAQSATVSICVLPHKGRSYRRRGAVLLAGGGGGASVPCCAPQSAVGWWWQACGHKAGTVTEVTWPSDKKDGEHGWKAHSGD